jgi:hypothetical protein
MGLAKAFGHLRFVVQDRGVVVDMGVKVRVLFSFFLSFLLPLFLSLLPSMFALFFALVLSL